MATMSMTTGGAVNRNADWYYANLGELLPKYSGKFVAIADEQVLGAYDTSSDLQLVKLSWKKGNSNNS